MEGSLGHTDRTPGRSTIASTAEARPAELARGSEAAVFAGAVHLGSETSIGRVAPRNRFETDKVGSRR